MEAIGDNGGPLRIIEVKGRVLVAKCPESGLFADYGDSGSPVVNGHAEVVGLITAVGRGSVVGGLVYISPIGPLIDSLKVIL